MFGSPRKSYLAFAPWVISFAPINMGKTGAERLQESLERKKQKKRESNARFYAKIKFLKTEKSSEGERDLLLL